MNIYNSTRTIYNVKLQTCMMASIPYTPLPNTTLNEKFDILQYKQTEYYDSSIIKYPTIKGITIGNGGSNVINTDIGNLSLGKHSPVDGALYNHIPFVIRDIDNDLEDSEKLNYRLRKTFYIDNKEYVAYYVKLFTEDDLYYRPEILYIDLNATIPSIKLFDTNRFDILNPEPSLNNQMSSYENSVQTVNMLRFKFNLDSNDLLELKNVFNILNIQDRLLTELGVVTGIDIDTGNGNELIYTQIAYFLDISLDLELLESNLTKNIEIGGGEIIPLRKDLVNE